MTWKNWLRLVLAALALAAGPRVFAHALPGAQWDYVGPSDIRPAASGVNAKFRFVRPAANDARWVTKAATVSRGTMGALARARLFTPWGAAIAAALLAADYLLDEVNQQVISPGTIPDTGPGICGGIWGATGVTYAECVEGTLAQADPGITYYVESQWSADGRWYFRVCWNRPDGGVGCPGIGWWQPDDATEPYQPYMQPYPLSDPDLWDAVSPSLGRQEALDLFYDPVTGLPLPVPEEEPVHRQLEDDWIAQNDADPATVPVEDVTPATDEQMQEQEERQDTFQASNPEYDTALETPEKRNLTTVLDDLAQPVRDYAQGIGVQAGGGQCSFTIPVNIGTASGSGSLDFCQFGGLFVTMGTIFLGLAYVFAGVIVLRA